MSSKLLKVQMKRSSASTAIVGSSWGHTMWRNTCVGVAPSTRAASSSVAGAGRRGGGGEKEEGKGKRPPHLEEDHGQQGGRALGQEGDGLVPAEQAGPDLVDDA